jgi:hypothetical protein
MPLVQADEIQLIPEVLHSCVHIDSKNWALRAIQDRFTVLSDEELVDFLNLARLNTYACFLTAKFNKAYCIRIVASSSKNHNDGSFAFGSFTSFRNE